MSHLLKYSKEWCSARDSALRKDYPGHSNIVCVRKLVAQPRNLELRVKQSSDGTEAIDPDEFYQKEGDLDHFQGRDGRWHPKSLTATVKKFSVKHQANFAFPVAIKEIYDTIFKNDRAVTEGEKKSLNEVEIIKSLQHLHIVSLIDNFIKNQHLHLVMFPVAACDLEAFMLSFAEENPTSIMGEIESQGISLSGDKTEIEQPEWLFRASLRDKKLALLKFLHCLCRTMKYLHDQKIRHKDIKPRNILIDLSGNILISDFGIAKKFDDRVMKSNSDPRRTENYAPPEMLAENNDDRDCTSDTFSLGCVFLEMMTVILGKHLEDFMIYRRRDSRTYQYAYTLQKTEEWIQELKKLISNSRSTDLDFLVLEELDSALECIRQMIQMYKCDRPWINDDLCKKFKFSCLEECMACSFPCASDMGSTKQDNTVQQPPNEQSPQQSRPQDNAYGPEGCGENYKSTILNHSGAGPASKRDRPDSCATMRPQSHQDGVIMNASYNLILRSNHLSTEQPHNLQRDDALASEEAGESSEKSSFQDVEKDEFSSSQPSDPRMNEIDSQKSAQSVHSSASASPSRRAMKAFDDEILVYDGHPSQGIEIPIKKKKNEKVIYHDFDMVETHTTDFRTLRSLVRGKACSLYKMSKTAKDFEVESSKGKRRDIGYETIRSNVSTISRFKSFAANNSDVEFYVFSEQN